MEDYPVRYLIDDVVKNELSEYQIENLLFVINNIK